MHCSEECLENHPNNIWCGVQIIKVLVMSSPLPCYHTPLRLKYPPPQPILKRPQPTFLPQCERPSFTPIQNNRQNLFRITEMFKFLYFSVIIINYLFIKTVCTEILKFTAWIFRQLGRSTCPLQYTRLDEQLCYMWKPSLLTRYETFLRWIHFCRRYRLSNLCYV
jgi:hypothetical protein